jgi:hypothetical protein
VKKPRDSGEAPGCASFNSGVGGAPARPRCGGHGSENDPGASSGTSVAGLSAELREELREGLVAEQR